MDTSDQQWRGFGPLASRLADGLPVAETLPGVVLFADLAGFTALGEALAAMGTAGGESLHGLVNGYFSILIDRVDAAGGEVTTFAGDALAAVFDGRHRDADDVALQALRCAVDMQDALSAFSTTKVAAVGARPHMRVGLGSGTVTRALVGDENDRVLHVLAGGALERAVEAQRHSGEGDVLADARLVARLPQIAVAARRGPWSVLRSGAMSGSTIDSFPAGRHSAREAAAHRLVDEHRLVTSVFLALPQMDTPLDGGARLQEYLRSAMPVVRRHGGDLRQVDAGDKGYQLIIGFGAPRAAADDAERAVACCLELVRMPSVPLSAGVATGLAFCAEVGTPRRREYVVIGDSVNVAARLAHLAGPGEVRVDAETSRRCLGFTEQRSLGPLRVKGRAGAVEAYAVDGLQETSASLPVGPAPGREVFLGRARELGLAREAQESAHRGQGQVLLVIGDPGVGKSRLVAQFTSAARGSRRRLVATGAGGMPGDARPYLAWRSIWRSLLFPPEPGPREADQLRADQVLAVLSTGAAASTGGREDERAPLLGPVLGVEVPGNSFTDSLSPAQRADATRALLLECLRRCCARSPVTVVVDDAQWLDELSQDLLTYLVGNIGDLPVLVVVVSRDEPRAAPLLARLHGLAPCTSIALSGLPSKEAERLVLARLAGPKPSLPREVVTQIARRSGGNPLFLEQLVGWARDHPDARESGDLSELPLDVRRLVLARVDRLLPQDQATLKAASVIADDFSSASISACLEAPDRVGSSGSRRQVERDLQNLATLDLISPRPGATEETYGFRHALVQEVVYSSLSSAARSVLHESVAQHLERAHTDDVTAWVDRLAFHYGRSSNVGKQRTWFRKAGDAAADAYANDAAIGYYQRLADLLPDAEKPQVLVSLGSIHHLTGRWRKSEEVLREALRGAWSAEQPATAAEAERELGLVLLRTRSFEEAVDRLRSASTSFARLGDLAGQARALDRLAFALFEHGDYRAALEAAQEQLAVEELRQDQAGLSAALENNGIVLWRCGDYGAAMPLLRRAHALARRSGDRRLIVHTSNDLAGLCAERGDHRKAVRYLREAITTADRIGYRQATTYLTGNAGELYRDRGDFEEAQRHFAAGLRAALDIGDWITIVFCAACLAMTAADQGVAGHRDLLRRARSIAGQLHQSYVLADVLLRQAEAAFDDGDGASALRLAREAEVAARKLSERGPTLRPCLLRLRIEVATGRTPTAEASRQIAAMIPDWPDPPEQALLQDTLARVDPSAQSHAAQAAALYRGLYEKAPSRQYAKAYERLTGSLEGLPTAAPLPRLAGRVADEPVDLDDLFTRVEQLAAAAPPSVTPVDRDPAPEVGAPPVAVGAE